MKRICSKGLNEGTAVVIDDTVRKRETKACEWRLLGWIVDGKSLYQIPTPTTD
jgi:hypothetical protein